MRSPGFLARVLFVSTGLLLLAACSESDETTIQTQQPDAEFLDDDIAALPVGHECDGLAGNPWLAEGETAQYVGLVDLAQSRSTWSIVDPAPQTTSITSQEGGRVDVELVDGAGEAVSIPSVLSPFARALADRISSGQVRSILIESYPDGAGTGVLAVEDESGNVEWLVECGAIVGDESSTLAGQAGSEGLTEADIIRSVFLGDEFAIEDWTLADLVARREDTDTVVAWQDRGRLERQVIVGETPDDVLVGLVPIQLQVEVRNAGVLGDGELVICALSSLGYSPCIGRGGSDDDPVQSIPFFAEPGEVLEIWTVSGETGWDEGALLGTVEAPGESGIEPAAVSIEVDLTGLNPGQLTSGEAFEVVSAR